MSVPTGASSGSASRPAWSSDSPSSRAEHNMPKDSTPRSLAALMAKSPGNFAPTLAHGTFMPTAALGAPHTICSGSPSPTSTLQSFSLSASGCFSAATIRATTTPLKGGATAWASSTSSPAMVIRWPRASVSSGGLTKVRSQFSENCMVLSLT